MALATIQHSKGDVASRRDCVLCVRLGIIIIYISFIVENDTLRPFIVENDTLRSFLRLLAVFLFPAKPRRQLNPFCRRSGTFGVEWRSLATSVGRRIA